MEIDPIRCVRDGVTIVLGKGGWRQPLGVPQDLNMLYTCQGGYKHEPPLGTVTRKVTRGARSAT